jgi:hypothetical protein
MENKIVLAQHIVACHQKNRRLGYLHTKYCHGDIFSNKVISILQ